MKVMLVDADEISRTRLRHMIESFPGYVVAGEAADRTMALELVKVVRPDVILVDNQIQNLGSIHFMNAQDAGDMPPAMICMAPQTECILSVRDGRAGNYLPKPVRRTDLVRALTSVCLINRAQYAALNSYSDYHGQLEYITAVNRSGTERVHMRDILYFWADQKYTSVFHLHGEVLIEDPLKRLEKQLEGFFIRVHRKALVAKAKVSGLKYNKDGSACIRFYHAGVTVPVSRRRLTAVRAIFEQGRSRTEAAIIRE